MDNRILIIDDEVNLAFFMQQSLREKNYEVELAANLKEGKSKVKEFFPDLLLLDLNLPDGYGLDLYKSLIKENINIPTIIITAHSTLQSAIESLKIGVDDYITKPFDLEELLILVKALFQKYKLRNQLNYYRRKARCGDDFDFFVSDLPVMKEIQQVAMRIATVPVTNVLIEGDTGTGKEMMARYIHTNSAQAESPFVEINCASLPDNLLESELFGYEAGAFTDAKKRKIGLIELARGGTLFLDEIAEMSISLQAKLLRFLENHAFKRLGGVHDIKVDLRVIAATNKNIEDLVQQEKFRQDLYFRLNLFRIKMPTLQQRKEEILLIAQYLIEEIIKQFKYKNYYLSEGSKARILDYNWPGNIRELRNVIERAIILSDKEELDATLFPLGDQEVNQALKASLTGIQALQGTSLKDYLNRIEKQILLDALEKSKGNQLKAAQLLNEKRHIIRYLMKKHSIGDGEN